MSYKYFEILLKSKHSIHPYLITTFSLYSESSAEAYHGAKASQFITGTHTKRQTTTTYSYTYTYRQFRVSNFPQLYVFGLWEEPENTQDKRRHWTKTPHQRPQDQDQPSCCDELVLTTSQPCRHNLYLFGKKIN